MSFQSEAPLKWIETSENWNVWIWIVQFDPENESIKILRNVGDYWSNDCVTSQVSFILEIQLWKFKISYRIKDTKCVSGI
jgi:hypothetical protein